MKYYFPRQHNNGPSFKTQLSCYGENTTVSIYCHSDVVDLWQTVRNAPREHRRILSFFRHFCFSVKLQCNYNAPERFAKSCLVFSAPALMHFSSSSVGTISRSRISLLQQIWMFIYGHTDLEDRNFTVGRSVLSLWIVMLFFLTPEQRQVWPLTQFFLLPFQ